jgi:hypothetical protein
MNGIRVLYPSEREQWQDLRNRVLLLENPGASVEVRSTFTIDIGHVMADVQDYLDCSYGMNDNPLRHLRRYFPKFRWEYHEITGDAAFERERYLFKIVSSTDYIWATDNLHWNGIVTARQIGRHEKPRCLCYNDYNYCPYWPTDINARTGARLVRVRDSVTSIVKYYTEGPA